MSFQLKDVEETDRSSKGGGKVTWKNGIWHMSKKLLF